MTTVMKSNVPRAVSVHNQVLLSLLVVWNAGVISDEEALAGFNNPSILVIGALLVAVKAIEGSQVTEKAARQILGTNTSFAIGLLRLLLFTLLLAAFLDSTSVVGISGVSSLQVVLA